MLRREGVGLLALKSGIPRTRPYVRPVRPNRQEGATNHKAESVEFFKTFPDNHLINHPYKVEIAQGEWTCTIADFTGTMRGSSRRVFSHEDEIETTYNGHGDI